MKQLQFIDEINKDKLLSNFLKLTALFAVLYVGVSYVIDFYYGMVIMGINFLFHIIGLFLYRKEILSYKATSNFYVANCCFVAVLGCSYYSGGLFSPVAMWFVLIPVIALLLLDARKSTFFWLITTLIIVSIYSILFFIKGDYLIKYNIQDYKGFFQIMCWVGLVLIVFLVSSIFENNQRKALSVVKTQNFDLIEQQNEINASNEELHQQKEELSAIVEVVQGKNKLIEKQSEDVKASILYASRIQNALLPVDKKIKNYFNDEIFILNKPRDIVSGDFYWFEKLEDCAILVTADCTGHGVPGAFMSMLGVTGLNSIVFQEGIFRADKILNHLHDYIYKSLQQKEGKSSDGMDVSVLVIHDTIPIAEYAGAMNSIYCIQNNELQEIKADKKPIGSNHYGKDRNYTKQVIDISKPTVFYTGSDGYQDQFGGEKGRKFMKKSLKKLMLQHHSESFKKQEEAFTSTLENWMKEGKKQQIDDILLMGFKVDRGSEVL
ncbi:serine phosphatase RsbU, regulator of sigma subunit [Bernardetia litoralis DSM 6794]|uniref:Serine phosphatase RsbU, regulator of sigma subunit n=1 Tax=Bernardetia litoralis (strain ATCC 23117 / DSM 6794 / NBRC 15988 / NCIMB 1366 / Fx l1 / Sio-4) TaxID=880071 RepID=I4AK59_BERLS|nr:SpoIIE family protein phosphatase [Bernardetia litoralis]AFM04344.1 serine phosphatase RsbU, regulator of sigma subunit [Bernardetia litoralis DSM 6794]